MKLNFQLEEQDYYLCELKTTLEVNDFESLVMLYQPLLGGMATSLYLSYVFTCKYHEWVNISTFKELTKQTKYNLLEIKESNKKLEALGLIKTFRKEIENNNASYIFQIYAPKTPNLFFQDPLFSGLLESYIGKKELSRLKRIYRLNVISKDGYANISTNFHDVYNNVQARFLETDIKYLDKNTADVKNTFSKKKFIEILNTKYGLNLKNIEDKLFQEISRLALLFDYNEDIMASFAMKNYHASEEHIFDTENIYNELKSSLVTPLQESKNGGFKVYESEDMYAKKVNLLNETAPIEYFRLVTHNSNPSPADINIVNILSRDYNLTQGVINVIIDYTLASCNQDFPRAYCEKLASRLQRLKVTNAMEAMNALTKRKTKKNVTTKITPSSIEEDESTDSISDQDLVTLLKDF